MEPAQTAQGPGPYVAAVIRAIAAMGPAVVCAVVLFTGLWMVIGSLVAAPLADDRCLVGQGEHCEATVIGVAAFGAAAVALAVYAILVTIPARKSPALAAIPIALPAAAWVAAWITFAVRVDMPAGMWFPAAAPAMALILVAMLALFDPWAREQPPVGRRPVDVPPTESDESIWPWQRHRDDSHRPQPPR